MIISHDHYDHLDAPTIKRLGNSTRYFFPLGLAHWFLKRGIDSVVEMEKWESSPLDADRFHALPVQHFSGRTVFDRDKILWTGMEYGPHRLKAPVTPQSKFTNDFKYYNPTLQRMLWLFPS